MNFVFCIFFKKKKKKKKKKTRKRILYIAIFLYIKSSRKRMIISWERD